MIKYDIEGIWASILPFTPSAQIRTCYRMLFTKHNRDTHYQSVGNGPQVYSLSLQYTAQSSFQDWEDRIKLQYVEETSDAVGNWQEQAEPMEITEQAPN